MLALVTALGVGSILVFALPVALVPASSSTDAVHLEQLRGPLRTAATQTLGLVVLALGAAYTARTFELGRDGQFADRLARAAEQLGDASEEVRVGAVLNLERLASDRPDRSDAVTAMLAAFVRRVTRLSDDVVLPPSDEPASTTSGAQSGPWRRDERLVPGSLRGDVQMALRAVGRRPEAGNEAGEQRLDLRNVRLPWARLHGLNFQDAILDGADVHEADLGAAVLARCRLRRADITGAWARGADFSSAKVVRCRAQRIELSEADLRGSTWTGTDLSGAVLTGADCRGAIFDDAKLTAAAVEGCDLRGVDLRQVMGLTEAQLALAKTDEQTQLPQHGSRQRVHEQAPDTRPAGS